MYLEVGKTDYMYKAMFIDSNLNRFWRCDNRIILLGMRFQYYPSFDGSLRKYFSYFFLPSFPSFFMSSDFLTFHHFLLFPLLLSSSCFLLCISVSGKQQIFIPLSFLVVVLSFFGFLLSVFIFYFFRLYFCFTPHLHSIPSSVPVFS